MAPENRSPAAGLRREQRIAAEVVSRFGLVPPVDVAGVVGEFANIESDWIPGDCDGLVVGLHAARRRPLVLLQRGQASVRERFTLAHELGHILLPWHIGDGFLCETSRVRIFSHPSEDHSMNTEPEANRFGAELLVPTGWLEQCVHALGIDNLAAVLGAIEEARVSAYVACIRLLDVLPSGYAFTVLSGGRVALSGQTSGTSVEVPDAGQALDRARLDRWASSVHEVDYGPTTVVWWAFRGVARNQEYDADTRTSSDILNALLDRYSQTEDDSARMRKSLAGVIGSANSNAIWDGDTSVGALYARFRSRFAQRRDLPAEMMGDRDLDIWVHKRAEELGE